jgi:hypothetical protein
MLKNTVSQARPSRIAVLFFAAEREAATLAGAGKARHRR